MSIEALDFYFVGVIVAWLVLFIASVYQEARILRYLRARHEATWKSLGEPPLFRRLRRDKAIVAFFRSGEHKRLGDAKFEKMVALQRVLGWTYVAAFVLFLGFFFMEGARR